MTAQGADKWDCTHRMLLESKTIYDAADGTIITQNHSCDALLVMQSCKYQTDLSGSYPAWIRVALYRWAAVSCPCPCGVWWEYAP